MSENVTDAAVDAFDLTDYIDGVDTDDRAGALDIQIEGEEVVFTWVPRGQHAARVEMIRFNQSQNRLRIFPMSIKGGRLENQFTRIRELQLESPTWDARHHSEESDRYGLLHAVGLPDGFNVFYAYGLGINRHYQDFVRTIEEHSTCSILRFSRGAEGPSRDGKTFEVSLQRFERYRIAVERNRGRARTAASRVNEAECHNAVADLLTLAPVAIKYGRNEVIRKLTEEVSTGQVLTAEDRKVLVDELSAAAPTVAREAPRRFGQLRADIELVTLETLVERFERDLGGPHTNNEQHWQDFFNINRFALQQLFAMPIVVVQPQAHVQGADLRGGGARIVDFLCANVVTGSAVVVEIKTPGAAIMERSPYRGNGAAAVHAVHKTLSGTIAQLQSQMIAVPQNLPQQLLRNAPEAAIDPWHDIRGAIIVGKLSALTDEQRDSFLRYRSAFSSLTILGYDEVLERLKGLLTVLKESPAEVEA